MLKYKTVYPPSLIIQEQFRQKAILKRDKLFETLWKPTYQALVDLNQPVWGHAPLKKEGQYRADPNRIAVFKITKGLQHNYHTIHDPEWVLAQPLKALPLLVNSEEEYPEAYKALKDRMSGTPQTLHRQDLVDTYFDYTNKCDEQAYIIGTIEETITKYITHKMYKAYPREMKYNCTFLAVLHINGREYTWCSTDHHYSKLILLPDSLTVHLYDADVLADEAADPAIHGSALIPTDTP